MVKSVITKIVGTVLILFGCLVLLVGVTSFEDGLDFVIFCLVFAAILIGPAILLIRWGARKPDQQPYGYGYTYGQSAPGPAYQSTPGPAYQPAPIAPAPPASPVPPVAPVTPVPPAAPAATAPARPDLTPLESLVARASDLYPSLKDLVRHDQAGHHDSAASHAAAVMLASGGLLDWDPTPRASMTKLTRTARFWTNFSEEDLSGIDYYRIISAEAALNVAQGLMARGITPASPDAQVLASGREHLLSSLDAPLPAWDPSPDLFLAYPGTAPGDTPGEWLERMGLSFYAENYPADIRICYEMASNVENHAACVSVELPGAVVFSIVSADPATRVALARTYSLRLCLLMARMAFEACDKISRVVVNGHMHGSDKTVLSVDLDRAALDRLAPAVASEAVSAGGFPQDPAISVRFDSNGWFDEVSPALTLDDPLVSADERFAPVELDGQACPEPMVAACGARVMSDLGINENAGRVAAWRELERDLGGSTGEVVSRLMAMRDAADGDLTVAEACDRTSNALVEGTLDVSDVEGLRSTFIDGSALDRAVARAYELTDVPDEEVPRFEEALAILDEALAPIEQVGAYLDDSSTIYRYFGSVAERIRFNRDIDDHARTVRLVPDSYFRAHVLSARFLNALERHDEALEHAAVVQRIAPASTDAALVAVRALEEQSRTFEAADLLVETLRKTATARDAALCHYRLAYMEWKLGRTDLAVACYQRALRWNTDIYDQARSELDDLLQNNPQQQRLSDTEAVDALNAADIPLGGSRAVSDANLAAAITCIDNGAFSIARPLMGIEFELVRDDTLVNVYRSLLPRL